MSIYIYTYAGVGSIPYSRILLQLQNDYFPLTSKYHNMPVRFICDYNLPGTGRHPNTNEMLASQAYMMEWLKIAILHLISLSSYDDDKNKTWSDMQASCLNVSFLFPSIFPSAVYWDCWLF